MKVFLSLLILSIILQVSAQDSGYATPIYQANVLCPLRITLTAGTGALEYRLRFDQTIVAVGVLAAGDSADMELSLTDQWYVLLIEWTGADDYSLSSRLDCDDDAPQADTAAAQAAVMAHIEDFKTVLLQMR